MTATPDAAHAERALLAHLTVALELVDESACAAAFEAEGELGEALLSRGLLTADQLDQLRPLTLLLSVRARDRAFAQRVLASGRVTEDEVDYAFGAQETTFGRERRVTSVADLLVEFGAIDEPFRDELLAAVDG